MENFIVFCYQQREINWQHFYSMVVRSSDGTIPNFLPIQILEIDELPILILGIYGVPMPMHEF